MDYNRSKTAAAQKEKLITTQSSVWQGFFVMKSNSFHHKSLP